MNNMIDTQRITRSYSEKSFVNKLVNLEKVIKFLEIHSLPRLNHKEIESLNRPTQFSKQVKCNMKHTHMPT